MYSVTLPNWMKPCDHIIIRNCNKFGGLWITKCIYKNQERESIIDLPFDTLQLDKVFNWHILISVAKLSIIKLAETTIN